MKMSIGSIILLNIREFFSIYIDCIPIHILIFPSVKNEELDKIFRFYIEKSLFKLFIAPTHHTTERTKAWNKLNTFEN